MNETTQNDIIKFVGNEHKRLVESLRTNINMVYKQELSDTDVNELLKYVINCAL